MIQNIRVKIDRRVRFLTPVVFAIATTVPAFATLVFNPTFNDTAMGTAGLTAAQIAQVHTAFAFAESQFSTNFSDPIHINITVTAVAGTGTLGSSSTNLNGFTYAQIQAAMLADAKSADDLTSVGGGGSVPLVDPAPGSHTWFVPTAEAKALNLSADSLSTDGTFTFGAGYSYTFDSANRAVAGEFDFIGVAMHEISEIMGRIRGLGANFGNGTPDYVPHDLFRYSGVGARVLTKVGSSFSIDGGNTLIKAYNNESANGGDASDWAGGTNDSFNAFSSSGVQNDLSAIDLRLMDVLGYDSVVPEPSTGLLIASALLAGGFLRRRAVSQK